MAGRTIVPLAVGQEVYVERRRSGGPGRVTRVGRKYLAVAYVSRDGDRHEIEFVIATWMPRLDTVGAQPHLMTAEDGETWRRETAAVGTLRSAGIDLRVGHELTLEQIEALAAVAVGLAAGESR
jgi:hypothetical protein